MFNTKLPRGSELLHLPRAEDDRPDRPAERQPPRAGALCHRERAGAPRAGTSGTPAGSASPRAGRRGSTPSGRRTPTPPSTPRSIPTSRRSSRTWRRSPPTSASPSSIPRSGRSSWRGWSCSRRRSRRSTPARSPRRAGALRATGEVDGALYTVLVAEDRGGGSVILPGPELLGPGAPGLLLAGGDRPRAEGLRHLLRRASCSPTARSRGAATTGSSVPTSSGGPRATTRSPASSCSASRRLPTVPTSRRNGTAGASAPTPATSSGAIRRAPGTGTSSTWTSATSSGPTSAFCPQVGVRELHGHPRPLVLGRGGALPPHPPLPPGDRHRGHRRQPAAAPLSIPAIEIQGLWNGYLSYERRTDRVRAGNRLFDAGYFVITLQMSPSQRIGDVALAVTSGDDVDFANQRPARSLILDLQGTVRPTDHLSAPAQRRPPLARRLAHRLRAPERPPVHRRAWPASRRPTPSPPGPPCG